VGAFPLVYDSDHQQSISGRSLSPFYHVVYKHEEEKTMIAEIQLELDRLEQEHDIKILYAVESGSRAWGFASTDSDWDVRYIYIHRLEWYLQIDDKKDSQEEMLPNDIDLAGWELKKALRLFRKSNPPMMEWLGSPIIYSENFSTAERLRELSKEYFSPKSCLYHYLSMADGNCKDYLTGELVPVKKYFYMLRPILACDWIAENGTMAPTEFDVLLNSQVSDSRVREEIDELLRRKSAGEELTQEPQNIVLSDFIKKKIEYYKEYVAQYGAFEQPPTQMLNE